MSDTLDAANNLRKLGVQFRGILGLVDNLEKLGNLEQVEAETAARVEAAKAELADLQAKRDGVKAEIEDIRHEHDHAVADLADAKRHAAEILDLAKGDAGRIVAEAHARAEAMDREAKEIKERDEHKAEELRKEISAAGRELIEHRKEIQALTIQIQQLTERKRKLGEGLEALNHLGMG